MFPRISIPALFLTVPLLATTAGEVEAQICEPELYTIPNIIATPNGNVVTRITIMTPGGPQPGVLVELRYRAVAEGQACWCSDQVHPVLSAITDSEGHADFNVRGGRCLNPDDFPGGETISVFVNGLDCVDRGQVSPDVLSTDASKCEVTLADAVNFTGPLSTSQYSFCHDLNSDLYVGLTDAVIFTQSAANAVSCTR